MCVVETWIRSRTKNQRAIIKKTVFNGKLSRKEAKRGGGKKVNTKKRITTKKHIDRKKKKKINRYEVYKKL